MKPRIVPAGPFWTAMLGLMRFGAVATPWRTVYVLPALACDRALLRHERMHLRQMARDGWCYWPRYYWWLLRFGYRDNPYEVEARRAERTE